MKNKKIAVFLHLYHHDLWPEIHTYLKNLEHLDVKLFVSLCAENSDLDIIEEEITALYPDAYIGKCPNKGLDVGPFLLLLKESYKDPVIYDYLIKIHTKKSTNTQAIFGTTVRKNLLKTLLGSRKQVDMIMKYLASENIGMIGPREYIGTMEASDKNRENSREIKKILGCKNGVHCVYKTMFWSRYSVFQKYFTPENIDILYQKMSTGWQLDKTPAHALERIFGHIVENENLKIMGIRSSMYGIIVHNWLHLYSGKYPLYYYSGRNTYMSLYRALRDALLSMVGNILRARAPRIYKFLRKHFYDTK